MGERKGQNKYYPPDFDYKKHRSLAGYHGQHPLRERARKLHMGILIIRFEMPYNIWCDGCNKHIAMGVRYNAEKSKIGMYYTTPIYKFRMKCHLCDNHFEIKTDPANHDYVIISGARRKEQRWDPHENEQIVPEDRATQKKLALDSMYKLEHGATDQSRSKAAAPTIARIVEQQAAHKDDFLLNQLARKKFRDVKKVHQERNLRDDELKQKFGLDLDLASESSDDVRLAELLKYSTTETYDERQKAKRLLIESRPLFAATLMSDRSSVTPSSSDNSSRSSGSSIDHRKLASLDRIQQISDAPRVSRCSAAFSGQTATRTSPAEMKNSLGVVVKSKKRSADHLDADVRDSKRMCRTVSSVTSAYHSESPTEDLGSVKCREANGEVKSCDTECQESEDSKQDDTVLLKNATLPEQIFQEDCSTDKLQPDSEAVASGLHNIVCNYDSSSSNESG